MYAFCRLFLPLLCLLCPALSGTAQQPFYKNYEIKEGLLSNYTYFVFQDHQGYIWVGSDVGVSRFDGRQFVNFNTANGLSDNEVFSMFEDSKGRLWFATLNGKPCFYQNGIFYSERNLPFLGQCDLRGLITRIFETRDHKIVYISNNRINVIDLDTGHLQHAETSIGIADGWEDASGKLFTLNGKALQYLDAGQLKDFMGAINLSSPVRAIALPDKVLVSSGDELSVLDPVSRTFGASVQLIGDKNEIIYLNYLQGRVWVGTRKGVYAFEYPSFRQLAHYLPDQAVTSMLLDREGGYWFSTLYSGLFYVPAPDILRFSRAEGLLYERVVCLSRDKEQRLWIGTEGGAYSIFDGKKLETHQVVKDQIRNLTIFNIRHLANNNTLVVGKTGTLILNGKPDQYLYQRASDLNIDSEGNVWSGLTGLFYLPKTDLPYKIAPPDFHNTPQAITLYARRQPLRLNTHRVEKIEFEGRDRVWFAANTGLYCHFKSGHEIRVLPYVTHDLCVDTEQGILWALTETNGLFALRDGQVIDSIPIVNQNGSVICRDLCRDENGEFWIGSAGGLFRVSGAPGHLQLRNYWGILGLSSEKINAVELIGDYIYIGKDDGFLQAPRRVLEQVAVPPILHLSTLRISNTTYAPDDPALMEIPYGSQPFYIAFQGLSYSEPHNITYRYRLLGGSDTWNHSTNRAVEYAGLRPGDYVFEVYAINSSGVESTQPIRLKFKVLKPFWWKAWFWILIAAGLLAAIALYIRLRVNALQQKFAVERRLMESSQANAELQKKNTDLRMRSLRLQMNPHFIFNALNTIKGYYGQDKVVEANAFISKFARLLRLNLDYSDTQIPLDQEISLLKIYIQLSQIRYPDKIDFQIETGADIKPMEMRIPSMILQPFVENAIIHGILPKKGIGTVFLNFEKQENLLRVVVRDDGIGRVASAKPELRDPHKPLATVITRERLRLLLPEMGDKTLEIRDLYYEDGSASGTELVLYLPYEETHEQD